jgi:glyoxylase-like metal-dependent hydrolase (beta-lactamase superfamily II)
MTTATGTLTIKLGASNIYLLPRAGGYVAIDAGANYDGAWQSACAQMAAYGVAPEAVHTVLITHGHLDHCGLARDFQEAGARIVIGREDEGKLRHGGRDPEPTRRLILDFLANSGMPRELFGATAGRTTRARLNAAGDAGDARLANLHSIRPEHGVWPAPLLTTPCEADGYLETLETWDAAGWDYDRQPLAARLALRCLPTPGHTLGSFCIVDVQGGELFTGDHVLEKIAPTAQLAFARANPGDALQCVPSLPVYLRSLAQTRELHPTRVLPGHGEPFSELARVIDRIVGVYEQRAARLLKRLGDGPATAWDLARRLYPHLRPDAVWLIMAEIIGLLDLLEERKLARLLPGELRVYEAA